jgi:Ca2+-binding EF-hand superfamily protein
MPKFRPSKASLTAVAAVALMLTAGAAGAQDRQGPPPGMGPGGGAHGPGMMAQGAQPDGDKAAPDREARRKGRDERHRMRRVSRRLQLLDTNKDGKVSLAEIHAEQKRLMAAADVNGDGKLSVEEFRRRGRWFLRLRTVSFFDMLDTDGDGQISEKEMTAPSARWFKRHDENKDEALDGEEFSKAGWRGRQRDGNRGRRGGRR